MLLKRREFLVQATALSAGFGVRALGKCARAADSKEPLYKISLAEWSLHRTLNDGKLDNLDFSKVAKHDFGIEAVEYVNQFFKDKAKDKNYLAQLKARGEDLGVKTLLIMIDNEGALGDADEQKRTKAIENHYQWVEAAKFLGCHSIRVNAASSGNYQEQLERAADGLSRLTEFAESYEINVIVENHGHLSSNGEWLSSVIKKVDRKRCGTLPDFGNFNLGDGKEYDRYTGVAELMPFAKAVSAKSGDFDERGDETHTDYRQMMKIVVDAGYHGYVGIEYEGRKLSEPEGIRATKKLLEKIRDELS